MALSDLLELATYDGDEPVHVFSADLWHQRRGSQSPLAPAGHGIRRRRDGDEAHARWMADGLLCARCWSRRSWP